MIESSGNTGALIDFETYLEDGLFDAVKERSISWNGLCNAGDFDRIYPIAVKILQEMEKAKLVDFEKQGRIKTIKLTANGDRIADHIEKIKNLLF